MSGERVKREKLTLSLMIKKTGLNRIGLHVKFLNTFGKMVSARIFNTSKNGRLNGGLSPKSINNKGVVRLGIYSRYQFIVVKKSNNLFNTDKHGIVPKFILTPEFISGGIYKFNEKKLKNIPTKTNLELVFFLLDRTKILFFYYSINKTLRKLCSIVKNIFKKRFYMNSFSRTKNRYIQFLCSKKENLLVLYRPDLFFLHLKKI